MAHATNLRRVEVTSREEWRSWLAAHHEQGESIWLVTYKKAAGARHVPYEAVVEEALCFGWVDSLPRKLDEERSMLLLSPRKPGSAWSRINRERAERMIRDGRMTPAGLARIEAARRDGSWSRLDAVEALAVPDDLAAALRALPEAEQRFAAFPRSVRRGILEWIEQARRPGTRARRVAETARLASRNERANQYRPPKERGSGSGEASGP